MSFCKKCGNELNEGVVFCPKCGAQTEQQPQQSYNNQQQNYNQQFINNQKPYIDTKSLMIWSIINLFLCWPCSVYTLIALNKVNKSDTQEEAESLYNHSKTACIIGTIVGIFFIIIALAAN